MPKISVVINLDTRPARNHISPGNLAGTSSADFLTDGVENKINFFKGFDVEILLYVDQHLRVPDNVLDKWMNWMELGLIHGYTINKHREFYYDMDYCPKHVDLNFIQAMMLSRGDFLVHFDGDTVAFRDEDVTCIESMMQTLRYNEEVNFISYPSFLSPDPVHDVNFDYWWASTRFFMCERRLLDENYSEIMRCLLDSDYLFGKYGDKTQKCPWLEHILGMVCGNNKHTVFYPPMSDHYTIFAWAQYIRGLLFRLNRLPFWVVKNYILHCGGIQYPNDVYAIHGGIDYK